MKRHGEGGGSQGEEPVFPRIRAGASLKPGGARGRRRAVPRFPPHSCGGLIEAGYCVEIHSVCPPVFPRIRAGASLKQRLQTVREARVGVFPRIRAGASLKQNIQSQFRQHKDWFSPAFVRGPH